MLIKAFTQNEYRQALNNSNIISDFSFLFGDAGSKATYIIINLETQRQSRF